VLWKEPCGGTGRRRGRRSGWAWPLRPPPSRRCPPSATSEIMFEYVGNGSAAIRGPVSGRVYRFAAPGDRVRVDARDRPGLLSMAAVRWVR
jgi:hypothetical protein